MSKNQQPITSESPKTKLKEATYPKFSDYELQGKTFDVEVFPYQNWDELIGVYRNSDGFDCDINRLDYIFNTFGMPSPCDGDIIARIDAGYYDEPTEKEIG